jgi:hypothetical protein
VCERIGLGDRRNDDHGIGTHAAVLLSGTAAINLWVNENPGKVLNLQDLHASDSDLSGALLMNADLSGAVFRNCKFVDAKFDNAILRKTQFIQCDLRKCSIRSSNVATAHMSLSRLDGADFSDTQGVSQISQIQTCFIGERTSDVYFDLNKCRPLDRFLSWSKIRSVGQLRLFLPSYAALIISIFILTTLGFLNERIRIVRELIGRAEDKGILTSALSDKLIEATQPWHTSWQHLAVLASTVLLSLGATLYLFCPSRIREFTLDQWGYLAGRPSFDYHVQSWASPHLRLCCAVSYGVGGALAALLLAKTLLQAVGLIIAGLTS